MNLALGVIRVVADVGYVLFAGPLIFWVLVWPAGQQTVRLVRLVMAGIALMVIATVARPAVHMVGGGLLGDLVAPAAGPDHDHPDRRPGGSPFFLPDIVRRAVIGWRRAVVVGLVVLVAVTLSLRSLPWAVRGPVSRWSAPRCTCWPQPPGSAGWSFCSRCSPRAGVRWGSSASTCPSPGSG